MLGCIEIIILGFNFGFEFVEKPLFLYLIQIICAEHCFGAKSKLSCIFMFLLLNFRAIIQSLSIPTVTTIIFLVYNITSAFLCNVLYIFEMFDNYIFRNLIDSSANANTSINTNASTNLTTLINTNASINTNTNGNSTIEYPLHTTLQHTENALQSIDIQNDSTDTVVNHGECPICLETISNEPFFLPCCHKFHENCAKSWLSTNQVCPVCMTSIDEHV